MLSIIVPPKEKFNPKTNQFIEEETITLEFEYSLFAIKKWESKYHIPFISDTEKTEEQQDYFIQCMCLTPNVPPSVFKRLSYDNYKEINNYINDPMTATTFRKEEDKDEPVKIITNEIIYYWMVELNIPQEYQFWHFNQLMTLINVINRKHKEAEERSKNKGKKRTGLTREQMNRRRSLNEARKKKFNTHG